MLPGDRTDPADTTVSGRPRQDCWCATLHVNKEHLMEKKDAITWFEIPATDLARAARFYETVLGVEMKLEEIGPQKMALFPYAAPGVGGCVTAGDGNQPAAHGNLVYLSAGPSLKAALGRVERAGGRISLGQTELPDAMGFFAHIIDSEGNRVGLHALA